MLTAAHAERLARWVEAGGKLISEACIGYFGDRGKVGTVQPNHGLDRVFGAREHEVEFMPDIGDRIRFEYGGETVTGGGFLQSYTLAGGTERGRFADGRLAVVEHAHGRGRTLLAGTHPGVGYFKSSNASNRRYFAEVFSWTGKTQHVRLSNQAMQARLHAGEGGRVLWVVNPTRETQRATVELAPQHGVLEFGGARWAGEGAQAQGNEVAVPPRDVLVVRLA
jgi:beta-galactosidase